MATITRSSILQRAADYLGIQAGIQASPKETGGAIVPIINVGHTTTQVIKKDVSITSSGTRTIYTTPADKDFYITFVQLAITKDGASDCTAIGFKAYVNSLNSDILFIPMQSLTAGTHTLTLSLPHPIKVDRNTAIVYYCTNTAGNIQRGCCFGGYIEE